MKYILILFLLSSCSMSHHLGKAVKKGYRVEQVTKEVTVTDTLLVNGKDSIIERILKVDCPEPIIQTKWRVRFDNKRFKDSLKVIGNMYSDSLDNALKSFKVERDINKQDEKTNRTTSRQENKKSNWYIFLIIGIVLGFFIRLIIKKFLF